MARNPINVLYEKVKMKRIMTLSFIMEFIRL